MRPIQRRVAKMIIEDVLNRQPPDSIRDAQNRYRVRLGEGFLVDNGKGWKDDIRDTSVWCLIKNGFAKAGVVQLKPSCEVGTLSQWIAVEEQLRKAAELETEWGSNRRQVEFGDLIREHCVVLGVGNESVYVYTDSRLDQLGDISCKIGRHESSDMSSVIGRVLDQFGTGNAGLPKLRYLIQTKDAIALETALHRAFSSARIRNAMGTEWFEIDYQLVVEQIDQNGNFRE